MRVMLILIVALAAAVLTLGSIDLSRVAIWAVDAQRGFQNQMAGAIRALKSGDVYAYIALLSATAAYGFVHALGPGHGKYLVGGVGLGTSVSVGKLVGLATASSLTQSLWAIILERLARRSGVQPGWEISDHVYAGKRPAWMALAR